MEPTRSFAGKIGHTLRKIMKWLLILLLLVGAVVFAFAYWGVHDEGIRAGVVLRISKKGIIFKTHEGQLNLETFGSLKGASPVKESFEFSVEGNETEVIQQLQEVALTGERVNLHYKKRFVAFPWRGDTKYFAVKIERASRPETP